jgi:beta-glucosidase
MKRAFGYLRAIGPRWDVILMLATGISKVFAAAASGAEEDSRIDAMLARLSLEEKLGQLQQLGGDPKSGEPKEGQLDLVRQGRIGSFLDVRGATQTNAVQRIALEQSPSKIPILFGFDVIHGYRTIFPAPLGAASSWDPAAVERSARIAAEEASAAGVRWVFAPMVDIARDPRWGRIIEGAGEDPYLGSAMARARVRGLQGDDLSAIGHVAACAKHWVAYGAAESGREYNVADVSERTLRDIYFPPFRAAREAGVATFMTALNTVNGIPATANPFTIGCVLRGEWQFDGVLLSDYQAVEQLVAHGMAADASDAARLALLAGIDMEEESRTFNTHGAKLVQAGQVPMARIDEAVRRVLRLKMRLGLLDRPYTDEDREHSVLLSPEHRAAAREIAGRSMVLLKNDRATLPLKKPVGSIAVLGPLADDRAGMLGHWRGDGKDEDVVTLLDGIRAKAAEAGGSTRVVFAEGCEVEGDSNAGLAEAVRLARESEVAIVAVGESAAMTGEASSRTSLDLPGRQEELVEAVVATGTPTVVVLINGRPLTIGWIAEHVPAILEAWLPGTEGGHALADVLFGDVNPGGKLPITFPRVVGQVPIYYNHLNTGRPATDFKYTSKYIDCPVTPLFPFGHGLSYTRFELTNLRLDSPRMTTRRHVVASVDVWNAGDQSGDEVVQLYIRDLAASVARPVRELKGFERVTLKPGEIRTVRLPLAAESLGFHDDTMRFVVEPGRFKVYVGNSSIGGLEADLEVVEE